MPNNIDRMLDHILFLARRFRGCQEKYIVMVCLLELGIEPKHDGYRYLTRLITLYLDAPMQVSIKSLYLALSALYNGMVDAEQIEQSIRSAIKKAWKNRDLEIWKMFFKTNAEDNVDKPSNAEFVSMIACVVDLWKGCCGAEQNDSRTEEGIL